MVVFWAPVQEHREQIPVTTSAQISLPLDSSGKRWGNYVCQHVSSEFTVPIPHSSSRNSSRLSCLPPALEPSQAGSRKRWMLPDSNQPSGKVTKMRGKHSRCLIASLTASAASAAPVLHTRTRCSTAACFLGVLEQETILNNYPFCLSCGHIQWLLVATLLENKIMCMLCSTTARTGPREDEISLFTVLRFPPSSSSRLMSRMVWPRSTSILCVCLSALEFLMFHLAFLMLVDHWADALLKLPPLAPKSHI